jgi:hypothetical protein
MNLPLLLHKFVEERAGERRHRNSLKRIIEFAPERVDIVLKLIRPTMTATEERRLKGILKSAVTEVLEERQDLLRDAMREILEDMALLRAIKVVEKSPLVSRKKIFRQLDPAA